MQKIKRLAWFLGLILLSQIFLIFIVFIYWVGGLFCSWLYVTRLHISSCMRPQTQSAYFVVFILTKELSLVIFSGKTEGIGNSKVWQTPLDRWTCRRESWNSCLDKSTKISKIWNIWNRYHSVCVTFSWRVLGLSTAK